MTPQLSRLAKGIGQASFGVHPVKWTMKYNNASACRLFFILLS
jgi:hypothetical protein